jgi:hypothetical protein
MLALVMLLMLLTGCAQEDPFVGTWQTDTSTARLTINDMLGSDDHYMATLLSSRAAADMTLVRRDNELHVTSSQLPSMAYAVIDYDPSTGHLTLSMVGPVMWGLTAPAQFSRIGTHTSDPFGPEDSWVKVASARGRLSSMDDSVDLLFRTQGGMVRISGTLTYASPDEMGSWETALERVEPASVRSVCVETVRSNVMPDSPDNVVVIDAVSARVLTPGLWRYSFGADVATYAVTIYVKR